MNSEYNEMIEELQEVIFQHKIEIVDAKVLLFLDALHRHPIVKENGIPIRKALTQMLEAYQSKDYLLLADILEFALKGLLAEKAGY